MKTLIWKEVRQQRAVLLVALVLITALWFGAATVWNQLVEPVGMKSVVFLFCPMFYAFVLAQVQFGVESENKRLLGHLVHRSQGARGFFVAKAIVGVIALACAITLPPTLWALAKQVTDPDALLIHWSRLPQFFAFSAAAYLVYAIGVLSTQLRRANLLRWALPLLAIGGAMIVALPMQQPRGTVSQWIPEWVAAELVVAGLLLWLALRLLLRGPDRDLPLTSGQLVGIAVMLFAIVFPVTGAAFESAEVEGLRAIASDTPMILRDAETGKLLAAVNVEGSVRVLELREDRIVGPTSVELLNRGAGGFVYREDEDSNTGTGSLDLVFANSVPTIKSMEDGDALGGWTDFMRSATSMVASRLDTRAPEIPWRRRIEIDSDRGDLDFSATPVRNGRESNLVPMRCRLVREAGRFSPATSMLFGCDPADLWDPADGTLWSVSPGPGVVELKRIHTPGEDPIVALTMLFGRKSLAYGRVADYREFAFRGKLGVYAFQDGVLEAVGSEGFGKDGSVPADTASTLQRFSVSADWLDGMTRRIRVERLEDHSSVFSVQAEPRSMRTRLVALGCSVSAFLRAPLGVVYERVYGERRWQRGDWTTREMCRFKNGGSPLLFALVMLFGAFQLFLGWRWMARGGVGIGTRIVYMLLILAGGVVALLFTRLLLPRSPRIQPVRAESHVPSAVPASL